VRVASLYSRNSGVRREAAEEIIVARREAWQRAKDQRQVSKADRLREGFWERKRLAADTADPRILAMGRETLTGGSTSNDLLIHLLTEGQTGYVSSSPETEEPHSHLMRRLLPRGEMCQFLGIDNLSEFDPLVHGRAAYRFFVMQLTKENVRVAPLGQTSVEIMQFGPLTQQDLLQMFPEAEMQRLDMQREFLAQFEPPTVAEMVADGIVLDGGHQQTLIKVASGHQESYQVISELYQLGLAPNATIGLPTREPFTDIYDRRWEQAGELAIGAQLGAAAIAFYVGRAQKQLGTRFPLRFVGECVTIGIDEGILSMAASIDSRWMVTAAFTIGARVVTMRPESMDGGVEGFFGWAREWLQREENHTTKLRPLPPRRVVPFSEYREHLETVSSPILREGYARFLKAHVIAAWRVSQFILKRVNCHE
jgi:hypothetical protein